MIVFKDETECGWKDVEVKCRVERGSVWKRARRRRHMTGRRERGLDERGGGRCWEERTREMQETLELGRVMRSWMGGTW